MDLCYNSQNVLDFISKLCYGNRILAHRGASSRGDPEGGARLGVLGLRGEKPWREEARGADPRRLRPGGELPLGFCPVAVAGDKTRSRSSSGGPRKCGTRSRNRQAERREASAPAWSRCDPRLVSVVRRASQARSLMRRLGAPPAPRLGWAKRKQDRAAQASRATERCCANGCLKS